MRTRILLTPSNNALLYQPDSEHVHIECDTSTGAFSVTLPDLMLPKEKEFVFYNVPSDGGAGNDLTVQCVSGQVLSLGASSHVLKKNDSITLVSNMRDKWLMSDINA
jgi:hypothetical protein